MKKLQHFLPATSLIIFFIFALSSCKKHTCECRSYNGYFQQNTGFSSFTVKGSAAKRKKMCTDRTTKPDADGSYTECVIR